MHESGAMAGKEWKANWPLVGAAMFGLSFAGMPAATLGLFMGPLNAEFGWSSSKVAAGMTVYAVVGLLLTPFAGALLDRYGSRRIAVPGLALCGLMFAAFSLMTGAYSQWIAAWIGLSVAGLFIKMMVWNRAVSGAFTAGRGVAVAVLLSGLALTQGVAPPLTYFLIESFGWRGAYLVIGLGWAGLGLLLVFLFFHETKPAPSADLPVSESPVLDGLTVRQALRDPATLKIAVATILQTGMSAAVAIHLVPILVFSGLDRGSSAAVAAAMGVGSLCGKLFTGWLIDRSASWLIPFSAFSLPALGYLLMWQGAGSLAVLTAAVAILGYAAGASLHMTNYLTTRYSGLAHFGKIFGIISSLLGLAAGITPLLAAMAFDTTGSYDALLLLGIPIAIAAGLMVATLGQYPKLGPAQSTA